MLPLKTDTLIHKERVFVQVRPFRVAVAAGGVNTTIKT